MSYRDKGPYGGWEDQNKLNESSTVSVEETLKGYFLDVKISDEEGNALRLLEDGLFSNPGGDLTKATYSTDGRVRFDSSRGVLFLGSDAQKVILPYMEEMNVVKELLIIREDGTPRPLVLEWEYKVNVNGLPGPSVLTLDATNHLRLFNKDGQNWLVSMEQGVDVSDVLNAAKWAESPDNPDPETEGSQSAKTWAMDAHAAAEEARVAEAGAKVEVAGAVSTMVAAVIPLVTEVQRVASEFGPLLVDAVERAEVAADTAAADANALIAPNVAAAVDAKNVAVGARDIVVASRLAAKDSEDAAAQSAADAEASALRVDLGALDAAVDAAEAAQLVAEGYHDAASGFADNAQGYANQALAAQGAAEDAAESVQTAQGLAESARTGAETAQGLAEAARNSAHTARTDAETAQGLAEAAKDLAVLVTENTRGGVTGQLLQKASNADYDYQWTTPSGIGDMLAATYGPIISANTAKVTNATHTGDVTGSNALTIANKAVTNAKMADMVAARIKGRNTGTGSPEDLTGVQVLGIIGTSTNGEVAALSGAKPMTPSNVGSMLAVTTPSGGSNFAPNFSTARVAKWTPTANLVLSNPSNGIAGVTYAVEIYASTATERTITFGNQYVGDLPEIKVTNTVGFMVFIYCVNSTKFTVSEKALQ